VLDVKNTNDSIRVNTWVTRAWRMRCFLFGGIGTAVGSLRVGHSVAGLLDTKAVFKDTSSICLHLFNPLPLFTLHIIGDWG
jgi:hypothetical protein